MKRSYVVLFTAIVLMFSLSACGSKMPKELKAEEMTEDTLYIKADGSNQIAYVSDFKEKYYSADELKLFMESQMKGINAKYGEGVATVSDISEEGGKIKAVLNFTDNKAYAEFSKDKSEKPISYPSFSKILEEYGNTAFHSASDEGTLKGSEAINKEKDNVVIVTGPLLLKVEKEIRYYSAGELKDSHHLHISDGEEAVVVFGR